METSEWKEVRREQQQRRAKRLPVHTKEITMLRRLGYTVKRLTDYSFRINGRLDLYPIHRRYFDVQTKGRGTYKNALNLCRGIFNGDD